MKKLGALCMVNFFLIDFNVDDVKIRLILTWHQQLLLMEFWAL